MSSAFFPDPFLRLVAAGILSPFPFRAVIGLLYRRRQSLLRSQSKVLLQSICTSVSAGYSLESSFLFARADLDKAFGRKSLSSHALIRLEKSLSASIPLEVCLERYCADLDYREILPIMHAMTLSRLVGSGIISILRNSCQMLSELIAVQNEVDANNAGRSMEALVLALMPFGVTYALFGFTSGYMQSAYDNPYGMGMMLIAFVLAVVSCAILLNRLGGKDDKKKSSSDSPVFVPVRERWVRGIGNQVKRLFPEAVYARLFDMFSELSDDTEKEYLQFIQKSIIASMVLCPLIFLALLFTVVSPAVSIVSIPVVFVLNYYDVKRRSEMRRLRLMEELPLFLSMLVTLLKSGVLLPKSIEASAGAFPDASEIRVELSRIRSQMLSGLSAGAALEKLAGRTPLPEAQAALILASRYEHSGGGEVLQLLSLQSNTCWSLRRNASRKQREKDALSMVIPMMLDLISVLIVAVTPAILSLNI